MSKSNTSRALNVDIKMDGRIEKYNVKQDEVVSAEWLDEGSQTDHRKQLIGNLLAGNVPKEIENASKSGDFRDLLSTWSRADIQALRHCLKVTPKARRDAWNRHINKAKRIHGFSLQSIANEINASSA